MCVLLQARFNIIPVKRWLNFCCKWAKSIPFYFQFILAAVETIKTLINFITCRDCKRYTLMLSRISANHKKRYDLTTVQLSVTGQHIPHNYAIECVYQSFIDAFPHWVNALYGKPLSVAKDICRTTRYIPEGGLHVYISNKVWGAHSSLRISTPWPMLRSVSNVLFLMGKNKRMILCCLLGVYMCTYTLITDYFYCSACVMKH